MNLDWEGDGLLTAACFGAWLAPLSICGVHGMIRAFQGRRRQAVLGGLTAGIPAALYYAVLCAAVLVSPPPQGSLTSYPGLLCFGGFFPLAAGFWAILLAYLIPEKPPANGQF